MRTRVLALLAGAALCLGPALVALPSAHATTPPIAEYWLPCSPTNTDYCVDTSTANGSDTYPGDDPTDGTVPRDYPWVEWAADKLIDFGVYRDVIGDGSDSEPSVDPSVAYHLVVRTGTFLPREMHGIIRDADYSIGHSVTGGWEFTLDMKATNVHHLGIGSACSVDGGGCGDSTTKATWDVPGFATGDIQDLSESGLDASEIADRTGMFQATSAQDEYLFWDIDTSTLQVRMANPHLTAAGDPVTDGTYDGFIPNSYLIGQMNIPDPSSLTGGSFVVSETIGGVTTSTSVPFSLTYDAAAGGIRIKIKNISFSRPTYKFKAKPRVPGKPRMTGVKKISGGARSSFLPPYADGNRKIDLYQAACRQGSTVPFKFKTGTKSPITVTALPAGRVYCQVRAHNSIGWGPWGKAAASHT